MYRCAPIKQARWIRYLSDWEGSKSDPRSILEMFQKRIVGKQVAGANGQRRHGDEPQAAAGAGETGGARWAWDCWHGMGRRGWRGASFSLIGGVPGHHPMFDPYSSATLTARLRDMRHAVDAAWADWRPVVGIYLVKVVTLLGAIETCKIKR